MGIERTYTAFAGTRRLVSADLETTVLCSRECLAGGETEALLVFDDETGKQVDFDLRGTPEEVLERLATHPVFASVVATTRRPGPGRPRLGVVSREVSLLPRHWDWLEQQPQGASAALRRIVVEAMRRQPPEDRARMAREVAGRFMWAMAGNLPGFEEASRALFGRDLERLEGLVAHWPPDIRAHLLNLVQKATAVEATAAQPTQDERA